MTSDIVIHIPVKKKKKIGAKNVCQRCRNPRKRFMGDDDTSSVRISEKLDKRGWTVSG